MILKVRAIAVVYLLFFCITGTQAQTLKPGFDADEYRHVLQRCCGWTDTSYHNNLPKETSYTVVYRGPITGLHNRWNLWLSKDQSTIAINLRGTTKDPDSWMENFYSAMIAATGTIKLSDTNTVHYKFADDAKAMVHVGWAIGACSMLPDIIEKIKIYYAKGTKQVIVEGHSQGGALAFLVTSQLRYEMALGNLPKDLVIKTYCSAGPKPGNLYYAYDFDYINRGEWAFNVVNAADWVPETPMTIQTTREFNKTNPLMNVKTDLRKQKLIVRWYVGHIYRKLSRVSRKNQAVYGKYLGKMIGKRVKKYLPQYEAPAYSKSGNYMRAGNPVILQPDAGYYAKYPDGNKNVFVHHMFEPYYYLMNQIYK